MKKRNKLTLILAAFLFASSLVPFFPTSTYADFGAPMTFFNSSDKNIGDDFDINDLEEKEEIFRFVFSEGAFLYKGPDVKYGKVNDNFQLPVGTTVSSKYYDDLWMYINYDGHAGWAYHGYYAGKTCPTSCSDKDAGHLVVPEKGELLLISTDINLYDAPGNGNVINSFQIQEFTKIPYEFSYRAYNAGGTTYYVNYNGKKGWLRYDIVPYKKSGTILTTRQVKIQNTLTNPTKEDYLPAGIEVEYDYTIEGKWTYFDEEKVDHHISYNGDNWWIIPCSAEDGCDHDNQSRILIAQKEEPTITFKESVEIYNTIYGEKIEGMLLGEGEYSYKYSEHQYGLSDICGNWLYVNKGNGEYVWVFKKRSNYVAGCEMRLLADNTKDKKNDNSEEEKEDLVITPPERYYEDYEANNSDYNHTPDITETMIWLLIGFGALSITIVVALIIAKHSRKSKDTKEKEPESEKKDDDSEPKTDEKPEENEPDSEKSDDKTEKESEKETGENSENREENEKKEDSKSEETDDEIEENFDEFLDENSPNSKKSSSDSEPDSEENNLENSRKGEKDEQ